MLMRGEALIRERAESGSAKMLQDAILSAVIAGAVLRKKIITMRRA